MKYIDYDLSLLVRSEINSRAQIFKRSFPSPEKLWLPPPWQGSRPGWMELWAPWAWWKMSLLMAGGLEPDEL